MTIERRALWLAEAKARCGITADDSRSFTLSVHGDLLVYDEHGRTHPVRETDPEAAAAWRSATERTKQRVLLLDEPETRQWRPTRSSQRAHARRMHEEGLVVIDSTGAVTLDPGLGVRVAAHARVTLAALQDLQRAADAADNPNRKPTK